VVVVLDGRFDLLLNVLVFPICRYHACFSTVELRLLEARSPLQLLVADGSTSPDKEAMAAGIDGSALWVTAELVDKATGGPLSKVWSHTTQWTRAQRAPEEGGSRGGGDGGGRGDETGGGAKAVFGEVRALKQRVLRFAVVVFGVAFAFVFFLIC
jgi:hypothetical protein